MPRFPRSGLQCCLIVGWALCAAPTWTGAAPIQGDPLDPATYGAGVVESIADALAREVSRPDASGQPTSDRRGRWIVASPRATYFPHSGVRNIVNEWGDTLMGIGFPEPVLVKGVYVSGQGGRGAWTAAVRAFGYRGGNLIASTQWLDGIGSEPLWLAMDFEGADRIVMESRSSVAGAGWYALDDLTFRALDDPQATPTVLGFEDVAPKTVLSGSGYAGLTWELGVGDLYRGEALPPPREPPGAQATESSPIGDGGATGLGGGTATAPPLLGGFQGVVRGDNGSFSYPPDTHGAIGLNHFVETVNRSFAVYDKMTGSLLVTMSLGSFLRGSSGDPRVLFDHHSGRWIVIVSDFSKRIHLAVSMTDDPTGDWFKTKFEASQGSDANAFPDYPTLGVDADGVYVTAYMFPDGMTVFAIDKAPLIDPAPSLGTVTAFRRLPYEGAIQPVHTYGAAAGQYFISRGSSSTLRVRRLDGPLTAPTLTNPSNISIPFHSSPPDAPALGSTVNLDTVGHRLMSAVYRDGAIWTAHAIGLDGRSACRWYQVDPVGLTMLQSGTVSDPVRHYYFPTINVNASGHVAMGFSGSHGGEYASAYYTGRRADDPAGAMAAPILLREGTASQNNIDNFGRNRFGDYSYTTLDPDGEQSFWTIQEYAHDVDLWGTWVARVTFDCNGNGIDDAEDIAGGTSQDCDGNNIPDECDPNEDCNTNGVQDICDIAAGTSDDCNLNRVPDACDIADGEPDVNTNGIPDVCEKPPSPMFGDDTCHSASGETTGTPCGRNADCAAGEVCGLKSRHVSLTMPTAGDAVAVRVSIVACGAYPASVGSVYWAADPQTISEGPGGGMYTGALLQCAVPSPRDWTGAGLVHLWGPAIVPGATYEIRTVTQGCLDTGTPPTCLSDPTTIETGKWGDVAAPFDQPLDPDFGDISSLVDKFRGKPGSPIKARALLCPETLDPSVDVGFEQISVGVGAFAGKTYGMTCTPLPTGPPACP